MTEDDRAKKLEAEAAFLRSGMRETLRQMFRQAVQAFLPHADQHDPEFDIVQWFDADEALGSMAYGNEASVLRRAMNVLKSRQGQGPDG